MPTVSKALSAASGSRTPATARPAVSSGTSATASATSARRRRGFERRPLRSGAVGLRCARSAATVAEARASSASRRTIASEAAGSGSRTSVACRAREKVAISGWEKSISSG